MTLKEFAAGTSIVLRTFVGCVFATSGVGKLLDIASFTTAVNTFGILPAWLVSPFSVILPLAEIVLGVAFTMGRFPTISGLGLSAMILSFLIAVGKAMAEGNLSNCGCSGVIHSSVVGQTILIKDFGLLAGVALVLWLSRRQPRNGPGSTRYIHAIMLYSIAATAAYFFMVAS